MRRVIFVVLFVGMLSGCGPSPKEVMSAIDALDRGFDATMKDGVKPEVHSEYINKADVTYTSEDKTIVHNMVLFFDTDTEELKVTGDCTFTDYQDATSGYTVNGTMKYTVYGDTKANDDSMYGDVDSRFSFDGGKIKELNFTVSSSEGGVEKYTMTANGKKIDIESWDKMFNMFDSLRNRRGSR